MNTLTCYRAVYVSGYVGWYAVGSFDELLDRVELDSARHGATRAIIEAGSAAYLDATMCGAVAP
jgi:hypothetical protein